MLWKLVILVDWLTEWKTTGWPVKFHSFHFQTVLLLTTRRRNFERPKPWPNDQLVPSHGDPPTCGVDWAFPSPCRRMLSEMPCGEKRKMSATVVENRCHGWIDRNDRIVCISKCVPALGEVMSVGWFIGRLVGRSRKVLKCAKRISSFLSPFYALPH